MRKPRIFLIGLLSLAVAVAVVASLAGHKEPYYKGRSLSKWLALYSEQAFTQNSPVFEESAIAVRTIGTNAIPFLLEWIRQEPPSWRKNALKTFPDSVTHLAPVKTIINGPGREKAMAATLGFGILGTNAASAIPELRTMMKDTTHPRTAARAISAISGLGAPAFPQMVAALCDTNQLYRAHVASYLFFMAASVGTNACLPPLTAALNDPDPAVRATASQLLTWLRPEAFTNAPPQ